MADLHRSREWRRLRLSILERDGYQCRMCGVILTTGRKARRSAVVDHLKPLALCPELGLEPDNLWSVCSDCHNGPCARIEAKHVDPVAVMAAKLFHQVTRVGLDGYPVAAHSHRERATGTT